MGSEHKLPRRARSRVDELPPDARERLDEMLADKSYTYQDIADALTELGCPISKSAIGRHVMRTNREMREINIVVRQNEALLHYMKENPSFDAANAALALLIQRLTSRIVIEDTLVDELSPDKALSRLIQAVRATTQIERLNQLGDKSSADARAKVMDEVRDALTKQPDLYDQLASLVGGGEADG